MRRIGVWLLVAGLTGMFTAAGAFGQAAGEPAKEGHQPGMRPGSPGGGRGPMGQGWMLELVVARAVNDAKLATEVGLSDEQVKTLKTAMDEAKSQRDEISKQMQALEAEQAKLMEQNPVDENAVMAALEKASQVRLTMDKARVKNLLLIRKTLTPEQVAKIKEMAEQRRNARDGGGDKPVAKPPAQPASL